MTEKVVLLGCGQTARALIARMRAEQFCGSIYATTRDADRQAELAALGTEPIVLPEAEALLKGDQANFQKLFEGARILVSFPPGGKSDEVLSTIAASAGAESIVYISSTGVYGGATGVVDENTAVDTSTAMPRLAAEELWRRQGAIVVRAPGLYSPASGLHLRLISGNYRLPANGSNYVSRIHLDDLARLIIACFERAKPGTTYVAGDLLPAPHIEVVTWLCQRLSLPLPASVPLEQVSPTLRGNRQVNAAKILKDMAVSLTYPTYVEGYTHCLSVLNTSSLRREPSV